MKVRFAPSPTGFLHIGGARTALFNWMYARSQNGTFMLRIEDTDQQRSKKEYEEEILRSMKWLGMDWDELVYQSQRFHIYREYAEKLVAEGKAYKDGGAILLKMPKEEIKIYDLIRGEIDFDTTNFMVRNEDGSFADGGEGERVLKDEVLIKADGSPAYNFCCAVDDALLEITCVIRGEDHISNTPRQIVIYHALGFKPPKYAHLPLIMGEDGKRLSKRTGAVAVSDYKQMGFLPDALINYLMLLGWSPGNNQEIISMKAALKSFSVKKINKAAAIFSMDKLKWINNQYLKQMPVEDVVERLLPLLKEKKYVPESSTGQELKNIVDLFKGRLTTLVDFLDWADFAFLDSPNIEEAAAAEHLSGSHSKEFQLLTEAFQKLDIFEPDKVERAYKTLMAELGRKPGELIHPIRVALTGKSIGPSLFHIIAILGKEKTIARLQNVCK